MGPSWHLLSTILGASCDRWSVYLVTVVLVIWSPFEVIWALLGVSRDTFWVPFWGPGASFGHLLGTFLGSRGLVLATLGDPWTPGAAKERNGHQKAVRGPPFGPHLGSLLAPFLVHWRPKVYFSTFFRGSFLALVF